MEEAACVLHRMQRAINEAPAEPKQWSANHVLYVQHNLQSCVPTQNEAS